MIFILLTFALACSPEAKFKERCIQHCIDDQEPAAWVPAPFICVCGPPRKIAKGAALKIPRNFTGETVMKPEEKRSIWE